MNIVVFGANGRLGRLVVEELLSRSHTVRAFVHTHNTLPKHERLEIVTGDVHHEKDVSEAVAGMDAVVASLGSMGASVADVSSSGTTNIIPAMEQHGVRRIVSVTGAGAYDVDEQPSLYHRMRHAGMQRNAPDLLADGEKHIRLLRQTQLDWTIVRAPIMLAGDAAPYTLTLQSPPPWHSQPYRSIAKAIVDLVESKEWLRQVPFVA